MKNQVLNKRIDSQTDITLICPDEGLVGETLSCTLIIKIDLDKIKILIDYTIAKFEINLSSNFFGFLTCLNNSLTLIY